MINLDEIDFSQSIRIFIWGCRPRLGQDFVTYIPFAKCND